MSPSNNKEQPTVPASPWALPIGDLYTALASSDAGISEAEAETRRRLYGPNTLGRKKTTWIDVLLRQFKSPLIFILIAAGVLTLLLKEWVDTIVILLAVAVNVVLGFYQEYKAENTLESLIAYIKDISRVLRGGVEHEVDSASLVPGDVIRLSPGMRVPADGRLISVNNFLVDESILTGESLAVEKEIAVLSDGAGVSDRTNMVFAGSLCVEGYGTVVITAIGVRTEIGRIAELVSTTKTELTPLGKSLGTLGWIITACVLVIVAGIFFLGISRGEHVLEMLLLSSAVAVGAIPEALPIALTVILTAGARRVAKKKGIIRSLSAAETLGSTTVVMTDKTGTLTEARMELTGVFTKAELLSDTLPALSIGESMPTSHKDILIDALLSSDVSIENPEDAPSAWRLIGRPLERNIATAAAKAGIDVASVLRDRRVPALPFNSTNKFSITHDKKTGQFVVLGAPDILLARATLSKEEFIAIEKRIHAVSEEGKRLIGVARIPVSVRHAKEGMDIGPESALDLEFLGVIALYDPIRPETKDAIERMRLYGASVVMVTGDLKGTAMAIARELGWDIHDGNTITGAELAALSDEALIKKLPDIKIFCRVTPEDKMRIGKLYQARGEVVAMTGDGVNDAPSLKAADIGIALGSGSDVAKGVSDLVILDDKFSTIVFAIEEGRRIISNIRKAFTYLMSNCLDEVFLVGGSLIVGLPLPLSALQIIWVNFFTGSLPALSFAFEQNRDVGYHKESAQKVVFNKEVRTLTIGIGIATSLILFLFYWGMLHFGLDVDLARTVLFACFASYILVITFSFKSLHHSIFSYNIFDNRPLNASLAFAFVLFLVSLLVPPVRGILGLVELAPAWYLVIAGWLVLNVAIVESAKLWFRTYIRSGAKR